LGPKADDDSKSRRRRGTTIDHADELPPLAPLPPSGTVAPRRGSTLKRNTLGGHTHGGAEGPKLQVQFCDAVQVHSVANDSDVADKKWYSKNDLRQLMDHELKINWRLDDKSKKQSLHCTWRGAEHIQKGYNKGAHIRSHVLFVLSLYKGFHQTAEPNDAKTGQRRASYQLSPHLFDSSEEVRRSSRANSKLDRKTALSLAANDEEVAKKNSLEHSSKDPRRYTCQDLYAKNNILIGAGKEIAAKSISSVITPLQVGCFVARVAGTTTLDVARVAGTTTLGAARAAGSTTLGAGRYVADKSLGAVTSSLDASFGALARRGVTGVRCSQPSLPSTKESSLSA